jgi:hypothetical protein
MASLRDWQGWWTIVLSRGDRLLGRYRFLLADAATVARFRTR